MAKKREKRPGRSENNARGGNVGERNGPWIGR